jgi:signal transduction histidine kinase
MEQLVHVPLQSRSLLIVDDEEVLLHLLVRLFRNLYDVRTVSSGQEGIELLRSGFSPQVIMADQRMPEMSGAEFLEQSRTLAPNAVRIILTGYTDVNDIIDSINRGNVYRFLTKPWEPSELKEAVRLCFEHYDVTTKNTELAVALSQLEELNHEKSELLGIVAHDLKNPMNSIRLVAEMMLSQRDLPENERDHYMQMIFDTSDKALHLISNLLSVEAIERGTVLLHTEPSSVAALFQEVVAEYQTQAQEKRITVHQLSTDDAYVQADVQSLRQVLDNLLSNAIKYSPHGCNVWLETQTHQVNIQQFARTADTTIEWTRIIVRDEGPGFTEDDKTRLFGKFVRLSAQPTGGESSTGLGLSIVKRFVEAMGGARLV